MPRLRTQRQKAHHQIRQALWYLLVSACLSTPLLSVHAAAVYRSVDAGGVVTFSDVQTPGAVPVQVIAAVPSAALSREEVLAEQQRIIDQQLAVADSLEASRLAREATRARRQEAAAADRAVAVPVAAEPEIRYVSSHGSYHSRGYPGCFPGHPAHPAQPIAPPPPATPVSFPVRFPYSDR
ncbi:MAG: DUF4124 domain-containing protein [Pseudomonadales bacterium]